MRLLFLELLFELLDNGPEIVDLTLEVHYHLVPHHQILTQVSLILDLLLKNLLQISLLRGEVIDLDGALIYPLQFLLYLALEDMRPEDLLL